MPLTGAGMRRHVHSGNHAAESFVSFIPLFDRPAAPLKRHAPMTIAGRVEDTARLPTDAPASSATAVAPQQLLTLLTSAHQRKQPCRRWIVAIRRRGTQVLQDLTLSAWPLAEQQHSAPVLGLLPAPCGNPPGLDGAPVCTKRPAPVPSNADPVLEAISDVDPSVAIAKRCRAPPPVEGTPILAGVAKAYGPVGDFPRLTLPNFHAHSLAGRGAFGRSNIGVTCEAFRSGDSGFVRFTPLFYDRSCTRR